MRFFDMPKNISSTKSIENITNSHVSPPQSFVETCSNASTSSHISFYLNNPKKLITCKVIVPLVILIIIAVIAITVIDSSLLPLLFNYIIEKIGLEVTISTIVIICLASLALFIWSFCTKDGAVSYLDGLRQNNAYLKNVYFFDRGGWRKKQTLSKKGKLPHHFTSFQRKKNLAFKIYPVQLQKKQAFSDFEFLKITISTQIIQKPFKYKNFQLCAILSTLIALRQTSDGRETLNSMITVDKKERLFHLKLYKNKNPVTIGISLDYVIDYPSFYCQQGTSPVIELFLRALDCYYVIFDDDNYGLTGRWDSPFEFMQTIFLIDSMIPDDPQKDNIDAIVHKRLQFITKQTLKDENETLATLMQKWYGNMMKNHYPNEDLIMFFCSNNHYKVLCITHKNEILNLDEIKLIDPVKSTNKTIISSKTIMSISFFLRWCSVGTPSKSKSLSIDLDH